MQVLSKRILSCLCNDVFVKAVTAGAQSKHEILHFCTEFKNHMDKIQQDNEWDDLVEPLHGLKEVYGRLKTVTFAILALLLPCPESHHLAAKDVLPILTYKGDEVLESTLQHLFTKNDFWKKQVDLTNKYAASGKLLWPKLQMAMGGLQDLAVEESGAKGPGVVLEAVCQALEMLGELREGMKPNATETLEALLEQLAPPIAKYILSSKDLATINVALVPKLAKGMELLMRGSEEHGIDENLVVRLNSWQASMAAEIATKHLHEFLLSLEDAFAKKADDAEVDYNKLAELLMQVENIGTEASELLEKLVFPLVHKIGHEALRGACKNTCNC